MLEIKVFVFLFVFGDAVLMRLKPIMPFLTTKAHFHILCLSHSQKSPSGCKTQDVRNKPFCSKEGVSGFWGLTLRMPLSLEYLIIVDFGGHNVHCNTKEKTKKHMAELLGGNSGTLRNLMRMN